MAIPNGNKVPLFFDKIPNGNYKNPIIKSETVGLSENTKKLLALTGDLDSDANLAKLVSEDLLKKSQSHIPEENKPVVVKTPDQKV